MTPCKEGFGRPAPEIGGSEDTLSAALRPAAERAAEPEQADGAPGRRVRRVARGAARHVPAGASAQKPLTEATPYWRGEQQATKARSGGTQSSWPGKTGDSSSGADCSTSAGLSAEDAMRCHVVPNRVAILPPPPPHQPPPPPPPPPPP